MDKLENQIIDIGAKLVESVKREEKIYENKHKLESAVFNWCLSDLDLRTRIFRFIDLLPQLESAKSIVKHIREYFPEDSDRLPTALKTSVMLTRPSILTQGAFKFATHAFYKKIAQQFIGAYSEENAVKKIKSYEKEGIRLSLDLLGESTVSSQEADIFYKRYSRLIDNVGSINYEMNFKNISIKLSALEPQFDPIDPVGTSKRVRERLRKLVRQAHESRVFLHIDMENYIYRDLTQRIIADLLREEEFKDGIHIGYVLQAYLKDADDHLEGLIKWSKSLPVPLTIRLVRGAYWDQEIRQSLDNHWPIPVFVKKQYSDTMFETLIRNIMSEVPHVKLAVATHNVRSIAYAIAKQRELKLTNENVEYQFLYGIGTPLAYAVKDLSITPRLYMPVGDPIIGMAYLVRRLLENVSNESFIHQNRREDTKLSEVLKEPSYNLTNDDIFGKKDQRKDKDEFSPTAPIRFHRESPRNRFKRGIKDVTGIFGETIPLVIGEKEIKTKNTLDSISPIDGKRLIAKSSLASKEQAKEAIDIAYQAISSWSRIPIEQRAHMLRQSASWMRKRSFELAAIQIHEVGKSWREADYDVVEAMDYLEYYSHAACRLVRRKHIDTLPDELNYTQQKPRGVTIIIAPWNFPMAILTGMSAAALISGNPIIIKCAEQSPFSAWKVFEAFESAGIPRGVINFLPGIGEDIGDALVSHPKTAVVAFTGSKEVGLQISDIANKRRSDQRHIKKLIVEMGGKNACIIDETADFDRAVPACLSSAFGFSGQKCSALSRLIVVDSIYDKFINRLKKAAASYPFGSPLDPMTKMGPVISRESKKKIETYIDLARSEGRIIYDGYNSFESGGYYVPPVIVDKLKPESRILREEIFGPLLSVIRARDIDEAIQIANDTEYALTGGLFSRTPSHIEKVKDRMYVGNLYINREITGAVVGRQPFGGYGLSGSGTKAGGAKYLQEFFMDQTISENIARHGFAPMEEFLDKLS